MTERDAFSINSHILAISGKQIFTTFFSHLFRASGNLYSVMVGGSHWFFGY